MRDTYSVKHKQTSIREKSPPCTVQLKAYNGIHCLRVEAGTMLPRHLPATVHNLYPIYLTMIDQRVTMYSLASQM